MGRQLPHMFSVYALGTARSQRCLALEIAFVRKSDLFILAFEDLSQKNGSVVLCGVIIYSILFYYPTSENATDVMILNGLLYCDFLFWPWYLIKPPLRLISE
jgi:hypothetical protein